MSAQFLRKASLFVVGVPELTQQPGGSSNANSTAPGIDLSQMRFTFHVYAPESFVPPHATIRVYNLSKKTAGSLLGERFTKVILSAGYEGGNFGQIFSGEIRQVYIGRESPTDVVTTIVATDTYEWYAYGAINQTIAAGMTPDQELQRILLGSSIDLSTPSSGPTVRYPQSFADIGVLGPASPRGQVMYGMGRNYVDDFARTAQLTWQVVDGQLQFIPRQGYAPGTAVKLNAQTGMIGIPQQTDDGIRVRCLINPELRVAGLVHIDTNDIVPGEISVEARQVTHLAVFAPDGVYRIFTKEVSGDTRGQEWYMDLICLATDLTLASTGPNVGVLG